jgi:thiol-disulfide isomerase/thioredoxin
LDRRSVIRALLAFPWAFASVTATAAASPAIGSKLELMDLPLIEGGVFRATEANGKVLVIYWWASWCPYCAQMSPRIEELWRSARERDLRVIGISVDSTIEAAREYRHRKGYTFPSAMVSAGMQTTLPKPRGVPVVWVRGRDGRVAMAEAGELLPEEIAEITRFL